MFQDLLKKQRKRHGTVKNIFRAREILFGDQRFSRVLCGGPLVPSVLKEQFVAVDVAESANNALLEIENLKDFQHLGKKIFHLFLAGNYLITDNLLIQVMSLSPTRGDRIDVNFIFAMEFDRIKNELSSHYGDRKAYIKPPFYRVSNCMETCLRTCMIQINIVECQRRSLDLEKCLIKCVQLSPLLSLSKTAISFMRPARAHASNIVQLL